MENLTKEQQQYLRENISRLKFADMAATLKCSVEQVRVFAAQVFEERKIQAEKQWAEQRAKVDAEKLAYETQKKSDLKAALGAEPAEQSTALRKFWDKYHAEDVIEELDLSDAKREVYYDNEERYWDESVADLIDCYHDRISENAWELFENDESEEIQAAIREAAKEEIDEALNKAFAEWLKSARTKTYVEVCNG